MARRKKKSTFLKFTLASAILLLIVTSIFFGYDFWRLRKAHFVHYPEFGIPIPIDYSIHGIDVSRYQDMIDWQVLRDMKVKNVQNLTHAIYNNYNVMDRHN